MLNKFFFVESVSSHRNWKVVLRQELRGQQLEFHREANVKLALLNLGNNANHVGLRIRITTESTTPLPSVDQLFGELITPTQVIVKEMVVASKGEDSYEGVDGEKLSSGKCESKKPSN
jgi:hypothetical protein